MELLLLLLLSPLIALAGGCFLCAHYQVRQAKNCKRQTNPNDYLPLRGRWLDYAAAALIAALGIALLFACLHAARINH